VVGRGELDYSSSRYGQVEGCCEQCDEPSRSIKCMKFLYWLRKTRTTEAMESVAHTSTRVSPRKNKSLFQLKTKLFSYHIDYSLDLPIIITYTSHSVQNAFIIPRNIYSSTRPLCTVHRTVLARWLVPASQVFPATPRPSLLLQSEWPIWPTVPVPMFFVVGDTGRTSGPPCISVWYATLLRMCDLLPLHTESWRRGWPFEDVERRTRSGGAVRGTTLTLLLLLLLLLLRENKNYCSEGSHAVPARPSCKSRLEAG
jgi:hypothetical protein